MMVHYECVMELLKEHGGEIDVLLQDLTRRKKKTYFCEILFFMQVKVLPDHFGNIETTIMEHTRHWVRFIEFW